MHPSQLVVVVKIHKGHLLRAGWKKLLKFQEFSETAEISQDSDVTWLS